LAERIEALKISGLNKNFVFAHLHLKTFLIIYVFTMVSAAGFYPGKN